MNFRDQMKQQNTIAYDTPFREAIEKSHNLLGTDITDFYQQAWEQGSEGKDKALQILKNYSKATADLSLALMQAREDKKDLSPEEENAYQKAKEGTVRLSKIQKKVNDMVGKINQRVELAQELSKDSDELVEMVMDTQEYLRNLRSSMNAYGYMSDDKEVARKFEDNEPV